MGVLWQEYGVVGDIVVSGQVGLQPLYLSPCLHYCFHLENAQHRRELGLVEAAVSRHWTLRVLGLLDVKARNQLESQN